MPLPFESTQFAVATAIDAEVSLMLAVATGLGTTATSLQIVAAVAAGLAIAAFAATAATKSPWPRQASRIVGLSLLVAAQSVTAPAFRVSRGPGQAAAASRI